MYQSIFVIKSTQDFFHKNQWAKKELFLHEWFLSLYTSFFMSKIKSEAEWQ